MSGWGFNTKLHRKGMKRGLWRYLWFTTTEVIWMAPTRSLIQRRQNHQSAENAKGQCSSSEPLKYRGIVFPTTLQCITHPGRLMKPHRQISFLVKKNTQKRWSVLWNYPSLCAKGDIAYMWQNPSKYVIIRSFKPIPEMPFLTNKWKQAIRSKFITGTHISRMTWNFRGGSLQDQM